jgi:hypothetical protein
VARRALLEIGELHASVGAVVVLVVGAVLDAIAVAVGVEPVERRLVVQVREDGGGPVELVPVREAVAVDVLLVVGQEPGGWLGRGPARMRDVG